MIIVRAPLRVSFVGGGTDIPQYYKNYGPGVVVSASINRYVYVTVNKKFDDKISLRYRQHENVDDASELLHPLIREILLTYGIKKGIEIVVISDVPARGSGLGASSALCVALCAALEILSGNELDLNDVSCRARLAEKAAQIEIQKVGSPIGKQDHYGSALGGMNKIIFNADESVEFSQVCSQAFIEQIEQQSVLLYMNMQREYHPGMSFIQKILKEQVSEIDSKKKEYDLQRDNAYRLIEHLEYEQIERFMDHVNENWRIKRGLHSDISNSKIDEIIQRAFKFGATAAKVCGGGGGGFLYLLIPPAMKPLFNKVFKEFPMFEFKFEPKGVQVVFNDIQQYEWA